MLTPDFKARVFHLANAGAGFSIAVIVMRIGNGVPAKETNAVSDS